VGNTCRSIHLRDERTTGGSQVAELVRRYIFWKEIGIVPTLNQIKDFASSNLALTTKNKIMDKNNLSEINTFEGCDSNDNPIFSVIYLTK